MAGTERSNQQVVVRRSRSSGNRAITGLISWVFGFIEVVLAFRFALLLLGANADAAFVELVYRVAAPFMVPFEAVSGVKETRIGSVCDWSTLLAIIVYAVVGAGLNSLIRSIGYSSASTVEEVSQHEEVDRRDGQ